MCLFVWFFFFHLVFSVSFMKCLAYFEYNAVAIVAAAVICSYITRVPGYIVYPGWVFGCLDDCERLLLSDFAVVVVLDCHNRLHTIGDTSLL